MFFKSKNNQTQPQVNHMIISKNISMSMDTRETRKNCNALVLGVKAPQIKENYILPNLRQHNCSYVIIDKDGSIREETEQMFLDNGYQTKTLDLAYPENSAHYNPFAYIASEEDAIDNAILNFVCALIKSFDKNTAVKNNLDLKNARKSLLLAIVFYLVGECNEDDQTLANILKLLDLAQEEPQTLDIMFNDLEQKDPECRACKCYKRFVNYRNQCLEDTEKALAETCNNLEFLKLQKFAKITGNDELDIPSLGLQPTVLYIRPALSKPFNKPMPILFAQLFEVLDHTAESTQKNMKLPNHVRVILDGYENYGPFFMLEERLQTIRPYNISCDIIVYDYKRLREITKPSNWNIIHAICDTNIYYVGHEQGLPEKLLTDIPETTRHIPKTIQKSTRKLPISINLQKTTPISQDRLDTLKPGDCLVFVKGCYPLKDTAYTSTT